MATGGGNHVSKSKKLADHILFNYRKQGEKTECQVTINSQSLPPVTLPLTRLQFLKVL